MYSYSICNLSVLSDLYTNSLKPFIAKNNVNIYDVTIENTQNHNSTTNISSLINIDGATIYKVDDRYMWYGYIINSNTGLFTIYTNIDYSRIEYYFFDTENIFNRECVGDILFPFIRIFLQCKLLLCGYITLHSSCFLLDGYAYAFTGHSGIGKSTRAKKLCDKYSGEIISGDRPVINTRKGIAYGVPWDGEEKIYRNIEAPLIGIFNVVRSDAVLLSNLTIEKKKEILFNQIFIPIWDPKLAACANGLIKQCIKNTNIFNLYSDIDNNSILDIYDVITNIKYGGDSNL